MIQKCRPVNEFLSNTYLIIARYWGKMGKIRRLKIDDFNNIWQNMASNILKFYKFAKKIPQIQKQNKKRSRCMTPSVASLCKAM
jgi:hypothetical protein